MTTNHGCLCSFIDIQTSPRVGVGLDDFELLIVNFKDIRLIFI
ncbi:hypothetical protein [Streptococcus cuniculi]|nr:hypothetical protein [Streptococcus cuniculi]